MNGFKNLINFRNRGGHSHEFGVMPRLVGGDSQIQEISLLFLTINCVRVDSALNLLHYV